MNWKAYSVLITSFLNYYCSSVSVVSISSYNSFQIYHEILLQCSMYLPYCCYLCFASCFNIWCLLNAVILVTQSSYMYLLTYFFNSLTCVPTYLLTNLLTYLLTYLLIYLLTYLLTYSLPRRGVRGTLSSCVLVSTVHIV